MDQLIKRLELIKTSILLGDIEVIEFQLPKIIELVEGEELQAIVQDLQRDAISEALAKIETYLANKSGLVVFDDLELNALRLELKQLEQRIEGLRLKRDDMAHTVEQFQYMYQLRLGDIINEILLIQKEIKKIELEKERQVFKAKQKAYQELDDELIELKKKRREIEERLSKLDPFDNEEVYEALEKELDELQAIIQIKQKEAKQKRLDVRQAKADFEKSPEAKAYQDAEADYQEFKHVHDEALEEERTELSKDDEKELKKLFRKAAQLCHPDTVADDLKEQATEMMAQLNEARKLGDLSLIREMYNKLKNGLAFVVASDKLTDKFQIQAKVEELTQTRQEIESEISGIEQSEIWIDMPEREGWGMYFEEIGQELKIQLESLQQELEKAKDSQAIQQSNIQTEDSFYSVPF